MTANQPAPDASARLAAVTGATGFIGRHLVVALAAAGWRVRVLARRLPGIPAWDRLDVAVVPGTLEDAGALERLVEGSDAVLHVAGLIKAPHRREFFAVNEAASARLAEIARRAAPHAHVVHVSTIAAREPQLSDYAASKRAGEEAVRDILGTRATVLRPPVVYGPGDRETLRFFQLARNRIVPLLGPRAARAALIHVQDLARLLVALAGSRPTGAVLSVSDARPEGYSWREIFSAAAQAVGNPGARFVQAPRPLLQVVAWGGDVGRMLGMATMLNSHKLREALHLDWSVAAAERAAPAGWQPRFGLETGFADTVAWYRTAGWLPA